MLIMVLNDGETWTNVEGCVVLRVETGIDGDDVKGVAANPGAALVAEFCNVEGKLGIVM